MSPSEQIRFGIDLFSAAIALFAIWKGGAAERVSAVVLLANMAIGIVGGWIAPNSDATIRLFNDGFAAVALLVVTISFGALWMGGVMLFYAAQFALHSFYLVTDRSPDYTYSAVNNLNWSGVLWCLLIGAAVAWRRRVVASRKLQQPAP
jgi:hypothetical protein